MRRTYTKEDIKRDLAALGVSCDDTVLIHTSYKAVGEVSGGPCEFIDAFCEYISAGLFIIPTHTWANVCADSPIFFVDKTEPCIGLIPRLAAFRKDGVRSLHPTHSVWVHGEGAEEFAAGEENAETPAPVRSLWWKLGEVGAKILLIGVGLNRNTYIHAVDEIAELDDRLSDKSFEVTVVDKGGRKITHGFTPHGNTGSENFGNFEKMFAELGVMTYGKLCDAEVKVIDAAKCRDALLALYSKTDKNLCLEPGEIPEELWKE